MTGGRSGCGPLATFRLTGLPLDSAPLAMRSGCGCVLAAATGEILDASYAGFKPADMDAENLLLYNIDSTAGGCFRSGARHGVRFEMAAGPRRDPPSAQGELRRAAAFVFRVQRAEPVGVELRITRAPGPRW